VRNKEDILVDLNGLTGRGRIILFRKIIQHVAELPCTRECSERCACRKLKVSYKFGDKGYNCKHWPHIHQLGNVEFHVIRSYREIAEDVRNISTKFPDQDIVKSSASPVKSAVRFNQIKIWMKKTLVRKIFDFRPYIKSRIKDWWTSSYTMNSVYNCSLQSKFINVLSRDRTSICKNHSQLYFKQLIMRI